MRYAIIVTPILQRQFALAFAASIFAMYSCIISNFIS